MSGVLAIDAVLRAAASVTALVPGERICRGFAPVNLEAPLLVVSSVSDVERVTTAMSETQRMVVERVQVTVNARTYGQAKTVMAAVRAALGNQAATLGGVSVLSILPAGAGPDLFDPGPSLHSQSVDVMVTWRR